MIHTFNNSIKVYKSYLNAGQIERYKTHNIHEPEEEQYFMDMIKQMPDHSCYINLGAAIGYYPILARLHNSKIRIIGVNPHPHFIEQMKECIKLNNVSNIEIEESAVSVMNKYYYLGTNYGDAITENKVKGTTPIIGRTMDKIVSNYLLTDVPLYIQMDIQGTEYEIIKTFSDKLLKTIKYLVIGTHSKNIHTNCARYLMSKGFKCVVDIFDTKLQPDGILICSPT